MSRITIIINSTKAMGQIQRECAVWLGAQPPRQSSSPWPKSWAAFCTYYALSHLKGNILVDLMEGYDEVRIVSGRGAFRHKASIKAKRLAFAIANRETKGLSVTWIQDVKNEDLPEHYAWSYEDA